MKYDEFLRRVPKVELHCHFEGTVRPATFADLANKHDVELPTDEVDKLYDYDSIYEFLKIFGMVSSTLIDREDFARAAYESIEDGVKLGNLKYREMFFNPTLHTRRGVQYATVVDGLVDGIRAAERTSASPAGSSRTSTARIRPRWRVEMVERRARPPARRVDRARHGRRRGPRPAREVRRGVPARAARAGCA